MRQISGDSIQIGVTDFRLAKRGHEKDAVADEPANHLRSQVGALLQHGWFGALVVRGQRVRARFPRTGAMTGKAPLLIDAVSPLNR